MKKGTARILALLVSVLSAGVTAQLPLVAEADKGAAEKERKFTKAEKEEARAYFMSGREKFRAGLYKEAIRDFQKAYEVVRSPEILYNIGRCHEALHEDEEAVYHYEMYLRFYPTADGAEDVKHRINVLREVDQLEAEKKEVPKDEEPTEEDAPPAEQPQEVEEEVAEQWWNGLRLGVALGADFPLLDPWKRAVVPLDLFLHIKLSRSWYVCGLFTFGFGAGEKVDTRPNEVKASVGLFVGVSALKEVHDRVSLAGRLGALILGLSRKHQDAMVPWLAGQGGFGLLIRVYEEWSILGESVLGVGPLFPGQSSIDDWGQSPELALVLGGRLGVEYTF